MPIRPEIPDRNPIEHVEIEYNRVSSRRKPPRPGFNRARMLDVNQDSIELASRESFPQGEKLTLTMHAKGVRDFAKLDGEVEKCSRITLFRQPAFSVQVRLVRLTEEQTKKLTWARDQLVPRIRPAGPLRRKEESSAGTPATKSAGANAAPQQVVATEPLPTPQETPRVKRPVALLQLIESLDRFEVSEDLIMAILEAAEAGMDVEVLYPKETDSELAEVEREAPAEALPSDGQARPMNVHRLASNARLHFSETGLPVGPAVELLYLSRLRSPENCFAVQLGVDTMTQQGAPSFKRGSILVFSKSEPVENGDFALIKTRSSDEFAQVFFEKNDEIRIRPLNPQYRARVVRRREVQMLCKLTGHYQDMP